MNKLSPIMSDIDSLADHCKTAEHSYQLASATGDLIKIMQAKRFWQQCDQDYQVELKRVFRNAKARQKRRQEAVK